MSRKSGLCLSKVELRKLMRIMTDTSNTYTSKYPEERIYDFGTYLLEKDNINFLKEWIKNSDEYIYTAIALNVQEDEVLLKTIFSLAPSDYDWEGFLEVINDNIGEGQLEEAQFFKLTNTIMNASKNISDQIYDDMNLLQKEWYGPEDV